jgi:hypothetical protein
MAASMGEDPPNPAQVFQLGQACLRYSPRDGPFIPAPAVESLGALSLKLGLWRKLRHAYIWRRIFYERFSEPLHLNLLAIPIWLFASYRLKMTFDLIQRPQHAYALFTAADAARALNIGTVTVIEFGVAAGTGLVNLSEIAARITDSTGINFRIVGFDTGSGLPSPRDYRDHPDLFHEGDFPMGAALPAQLPDGVELVIGDLSETMPTLVTSPAAPLGVVILDVDYYWSSKAALEILDRPPTHYLPCVQMYIDDIALERHNPWCGEWLAIREFNRDHEMRKIGRDEFLVTRRLFKHAKWIQHMHVCHVLDHPDRQVRSASKP